MGLGSSTPLPEEVPTISEGAAKIFFPEDVDKSDVFYNPVQIFNRDLTCLVLRGFKELYGSDLTIFEAFAASGLRSIRYALEVPGISSIVANDIDPKAVAVIEKNINVNKVSNIVTSSLGDACLVLGTTKKKFSVIDLDPYSTAAPFLDGAVQAVTDGGLLCVTSTDGRTLCGTQPETSYAWYDVMTMNTDFTHEFGIRTLLTTIATCAARYNRRIEPLISLAANFYFRVFVRIHDKPFDSPASNVPLCLCLYSHDSASFWLQPFSSLFQAEPQTVTIQRTTDPWTGGKLKIGGPIYSGPLHSRKFISSLLDFIPQMTHITTEPRIRAVLHTTWAEIEAPLYYDAGTLCGIAKSSCPPRAVVITQLEKNGYEVSITHTKPGMYKTNAPAEVVWDVIRAYYFSEGKSLPEEDGPARKILSAKPTVDVKIEADEEVVIRLRKEKSVCKFYENPSSHFGPKSAVKKKGPSSNK